VVGPYHAWVSRAIEWNKLSASLEREDTGERMMRCLRHSYKESPHREISPDFLQFTGLLNEKHLPEA
jgi:hypothetical protein